MEYIISALWFSLECVAFFLFASAFLPYRYNRRRTILTAFGICVLLLLSQSLPLPALALRLCALVFGLCLIVFLFQGRLAQRLFIGLLDYILIVAMDAIVLFGASTVLRISLDELVWKKGMYTVLVTAGKILSVFLAWLITRLHPFQRLHPLRPQWMLLAGIFPLTSLLMLMAMFLLCRDERELTQPVALFCLFLGIANAAIVYIVSLLERDTEITQQNHIGCALPVDTMRAGSRSPARKAGGLNRDGLRSGQRRSCKRRLCAFKRNVTAALFPAISSFLSLRRNGSRSTPKRP